MNKKDNMFYSKETINKIRDIDALTYLLNEEPDNLVKDSRTTYSTKEHDSLKLSNGMWYWFSRGIGGKCEHHKLSRQNHRNKRRI